MIKEIPLADVILDAGTQIRAEINQEVVDEYAEAYESKKELPPIDVFVDGDKFICVDGFHRCYGALQIERDKLPATLHSGNKSDALKFALGANSRHGLKRTNADKRRAAQIALKEFPKLSDHLIADMCAVSQPFISEIRNINRKPLSVPSTCKSTKVAPKRVGKDGKSRKVDNAALEDICSHNPPKGLVDKTGFPVPPEAAPMFLRESEVKEKLSAIMALRKSLTELSKGGDLLWSPVNWTTVAADFSRIHYAVQVALPFAVCPTCQGRVANSCQLCEGRGAISKFLWDTGIAQETKTIRAKIVEKLKK